MPPTTTTTTTTTETLKTKLFPAPPIMATCANVTLTTGMTSTLRPLRRNLPSKRSQIPRHPRPTQLSRPDHKRFNLPSIAVADFGVSYMYSPAEDTLSTTVTADGKQTTGIPFNYGAPDDFLCVAPLGRATDMRSLAATMFAVTDEAARKKRREEWGTEDLLEERMLRHLRYRVGSDEEDEDDEYWEGHGEENRQYEYYMTRDDIHQFGDLLGSMFKWKSGETASLERIMKHPWFEGKVFPMAEVELKWRLAGRIDRPIS
ncbi:hypothetical protein N657DRAFT_673586 [Parathielavia appendiculata]|uniref:Protein kinase domain-containing protein n=1 Tax=Parathielavia appendiculata TaxID=2587402 RepID=A0AAN6Z259_9PEZI|nr:hypothetical protein N657DRAFT_673586 [Parathielavia appendiculata]